MQTGKSHSQIYVCPDLKSDPGGERTSLAKVLDKSGYGPKVEIELVLDDGVLTLDISSVRRST